jgi:triosephosphate isomerase
MNKKFIISNWKMLPSSVAEAKEIISRADEFLQGLAERIEPSLVLCPPFVFLDEVQEMLGSSHMLHDAELGAQDIAVQDAGAMTGEVSGPQLRASGVRYVIVGHSARRWKMGEDDAMVNTKLKAALRNDLIPIVCVGERTREGDWRDWLFAQVRATFAELSGDDIIRCLVAYEPVWAISTNPDARPDTPESALESIELIRTAFTENWNLKIENVPRFLYGGSVKPANAADFLEPDGINGVLVGGASVRPDDYVGILRAAANIRL